LLDLGQWEQAAEELTRLPVDSLTLSSLASCSYFQGQSEQAQKLAQRALELNPYDPRALYILAAQGRDLQLAQKLTSLCPVMPNAWILLAELQLQQGQSKLAQQSVEAGWNWAGQHPRLEQLGQQLGLKFR
jgi:tetratricopeptide (TPR) repeat protein